MSDALELLRDWPTWRKAGAGKVLASPAWRFRVMLNDEERWIRNATDAEEAKADMTWVELAFEDERHVLGLADSETFPDLHLVWAKRGGLPPEVLMALVEKECGPLLQMLEDLFRKQLSIVGFTEGAGERRTRVFEVDTEDGSTGRDAIRFAIDLSPALEMELGRVENLDVGHESIRGQVRDAEAEYAAFALPEDATLSIGDMLLLPDEATPNWLTDVPDDDETVRVLADRTLSLTFAELADGLPPVPDSETFRIVRAGRAVATAVRSRVGTHPSFRIVSAIPPVNRPIP